MRTAEPTCGHAGQAAFRVRLTPEQAHQSAVDVRHHGTRRANRVPAPFESLGEGKFESVRTHAPGQKPSRFRPDAGAIESGLEGQQQCRFALEGGRFVFTGFPVDPFDSVQEAQEATRQAVGIRHPVARQAMPEITRLADVQDRIAGAVHEIDPGPLGQLPEEGLAQAVNRRTRVRPETELGRFHCAHLPSSPRTQPLNTRNTRIMSQWRKCVFQSFWRVWHVSRFTPRIRAPLFQHRIVPEQGNPFLGREPVLLRPAAQFGLAVQASDELGLAKNRHDFVCVRSDPIAGFEFHAGDCTGGGGTSVGGGGKVASWELGGRLCRERSTHDVQEPLSL